MNRSQARAPALHTKLGQHPRSLLLTLGRTNGKLSYFLPVRKSSNWTIFENKQLAIGNWQLARKPNPFHAATLCRPNSKNGKTGLKLHRIEALRNGENGFRPLGHRSVELHFSFCFQQSV